MAENWLTSFEKDSVDSPVGQLIIGGTCGLVAGELCYRNRAAPVAVVGGLVLFRVAHELGFIELNVTRTPKGGRQDGGDDEASSDAGSGVLEQSKFAMCTLAKNNAFMAAGFAVGFLWTHC